MTTPIYRDSPGPMLWRILSALDTNIAALDASPFRRNDFAGDLAWNRSKTPLVADLATPRAHLQYMIAIRGHTPNGRARAGGMIEMVADTEIAFAYLAIHDDQWESYRLSMQAAHMLRTMVLSCNWIAGAGLDPLTVQMTQSFAPAAIPQTRGGGGTAGLVITQRYNIIHVEDLTR